MTSPITHMFQSSPSKLLQLNTSAVLNIKVHVTMSNEFSTDVLNIILESPTDVRSRVLNVTALYSGGSGFRSGFGVRLYELS